MTVTLKQLLEAGCHFGHQSRRWDPKMKQYLFAEREGVHIFDLVKTKEGLERACEFVKDLVANGGVVVMVGSKRQAEGIVKETAKRVGMPYVTERWLGGTFTNFSQIHRRVERMENLTAKRLTGDFKGLTKREQLLIDREITDLERFFGGIRELKKIPEAVFIVDLHKEKTAVREARRMGVKVVGLVDSNADPEGADIVIPANDDAAKSVQLIVEEIGRSIEEGKKRLQEKESVDANKEEKAGGKGKKVTVVRKLDEVADQPEEV